MNKISLKDEDGFSFVSYKGKKKSNSIRAYNSPAVDPLKDFGTIINNIQDELKFSDFIVKFKQDLCIVLQEWNLENRVKDESNDNFSKQNVKDSFVNNEKLDIDIICYGLGQFSSCIIARYQLGFLLILKHILQSSNVYIYDPQFSIEEIGFLNELNLNVLNVNEEAKRASNKKTVCFLPHCDLPLYNNLLWANWSIKNLSELVIIGNSFQSYEINDAKSQLEAKAKYVYLANKFATEIKISNVFRFTDIFNDLSIHYFKSASLSVLEPYVWMNVDEPEYSDEDIIKNK